MPANIEKMAYVSIEGGTWHGLGEALDRYPTSAEMLRASGLDWGVERSPMLADTVGRFRKLTRRPMTRCARSPVATSCAGIRTAHRWVR